MSKTYTAVMFFDENITIDSHSATEVRHLGEVTIAEFAREEPCTVAACEENGELLVQVGRMGHPGYRFMQGPEI